MKELTIILFLLCALHMFSLILINRYRLQKIKDHLKKIKGRGLSSKKYTEMVERYEGMMKHIEGFPSEIDYPEIYLDEGFTEFKRKTLRLIKYFAIAIPSLLAIVVLLICLFKPK
jgi:hypothetical protein